jgi:hypothetical protein
MGRAISRVETAPRSPCLAQGSGTRKAVALRGLLGRPMGSHHLRHGPAAHPPVTGSYLPFPRRAAHPILPVSLFFRVGYMRAQWHSGIVNRYPPPTHQKSTIPRMPGFSSVMPECRYRASSDKAGSSCSCSSKRTPPTPRRTPTPFGRHMASNHHLPHRPAPRPPVSGPYLPSPRRPAHPILPISLRFNGGYTHAQWPSGLSCCCVQGTVAQ